jgi:hypothetical protein
MPTRRNSTERKIGAAAVILAALIAATGAIVAAFVGRESPPPEPEPVGRILSPRSGEAVPRGFTVEGTLSAIPQDNHVWVAVQVDNLLFPKEPEIPAQDRRWSQQVVEAGLTPGATFSLALFMVNELGQRAIEDWIERGVRRDGFAGLEGIPGSVKLDVVLDLVVSK